MLEDLQAGYNVSLIIDDIKVQNLIKSHLQSERSSLQQRLYIVSSKELKEWLEKEVKEEAR